MLDIDPQYYKNVYVADSAISGRGLFAGEFIKKGDPILRFGGTLALQCNRHSGRYLESTFLSISEDSILCETVSSVKDPSDYINHSCSPNTGMKDCITLIAIRDISPNEEILCDYAFWEGDICYVMKEHCRCGSNKCRGTITGKDWSLFTTESEMYQYFSPFIRRRIAKNQSIENTDERTH